MNELDLTIFHIAHEPITTLEIHSKLQRRYGKIIPKKTIYTSIYRLEKQGFITKQEAGKKILIQQASLPVASYLHNIIVNYPHLIDKEVFKETSLCILLTLLHNKCNIKWISEINNMSIRNIRRHLTKLHKFALVTKHNDESLPNVYAWEINRINSEFVKFLEAYEEFRAFKILEPIDKNAGLIWLHGTEFLIKTKKTIKHANFKETAAAALEKYGFKLLPGENFYLYAHRKLNLWDHAFLTVVSRKQDPTQIRYLAYLYKKQKTAHSEFIHKGNYYDPHAMQLVLDLFKHKKETPQLKMEDIKELERLYER